MNEIVGYLVLFLAVSVIVINIASTLSTRFRRWMYSKDNHDMKILYKTAKVIYNAHLNQYEIWYKNWFFWHFDSCYKVSEYLKNEMAKDKAIERAQALLDTVEVWKQSNITYY